MNFKPGDKVRFLNTTGGGVVAKIINSFMVSVSIEDGFEIPTLVSELVLVEPSGVNDRLFAPENPVREPAKTFIPPQPADQNRITEIEPIRDDNSLPSGVYLAYTPHDQQWIMTGNLDIYLINNTDNDILYSFFLKEEEGTYSGVDYGSVSPKSKLLLESIIREDINHWSGGIIQVLFHIDEGDRVLMPVSVSFRIKGSVFYKETSYKSCGLLGSQKAIIYTVCEFNRLPSTLEHLLNEKEGGESALPETAKQFVPSSAIDKHRIAPREAEVDLHISALRDNYDQLTAREILTIQLGTFDRLLESALANNYTRVVFIHGIGNGTLKQALIDRIKDYGDIEFRTASFTRYGNGAIEIVLHQNM